MHFTSNLNLSYEKTLVKGCIEGNRIYQNQLYTIFAAQMMGVCLRYAKTKEDAEDILQEGFIQVFASIKQFKFNGTLHAWIRKIFINCALQKLRGKENNYVFTGIEYSNAVQKMTCPSTEEIDMKLLIKCIQNLPTISRLVFNLFVFEGCKHKEIARMLNISEGTSKSNLFDARNNLRKQLKAFDYFILKSTADEQKFTQ